MSWFRDWKYRIKFVVDSSKIDEPLQEFPVKIQLTSEHSHIFHIIGKQNRRIAAVSLDKHCYVEIEKWDPITFSATLWIKLPFVSDGVDTNIYLYYDENQPNNSNMVGGSYALSIDMDDDFTGDDGDPPDPDKWYIGSGRSIEINSNTLNMYLRDSDNDSYGNSYSVNSKNRLVGDFDIQIDWDLIQYTIINNWYTGLQINAGGGNYWTITVSSEGSGNIKYYGFWNGGGGSFIDLGHTSGQFRITRVGDVISLYYYNGGWALYPHSGGTNSKSVIVQIIANQQNIRPDLEVEYDDFVVTSGDVVNSWGGASTVSNVWDSNYVGVWHMNWTPPDTIYDSTNNNSDGTTAGSMTSSDLINGVSGKSLNFDGTDDRITPANDYGDTDTDVLFVEALIRSTNHSIWQRMIARFQGVAPSGYYGWNLDVTNTGKIYWASNESQGSNGLIYSDNAIKLNDWTYVVGTKETGTGADMTLFIDGIKQTDTDSSVSGTTHVNNVTIGWDSYSSNMPYYGDICEVRFSNIVRSDAWIKATHHSLFDTLFTSTTIENRFKGWQDRHTMTIDHNKIDENLTNFPIRLNTANLGGYNANDITDTFDQLDVDMDLYDQHTKLLMHSEGDLSDCKHDVIFMNEPQITATGPFNGSYSFDGTDNYIAVLNKGNFNFSSANFTIDYWIKTPSTLRLEELISKRPPSTVRWIINRIADDSGWKIQFYDQNAATYRTAGSIIADTWYHVAICRDGNNFYTFLNGVAGDTWSNAASITHDTSNITIGRNNVGLNYFSGSFSNIRISYGIARWTTTFTPSTEMHTPDEYDVLILPCTGDMSKSGHTLTINNDPEGHADIARFDGSYYFDGTNNITIPDSTDWDFGADDFTIDFWIKTTYSGGTFAPVIAIQNTTHWGVFVTNSGLINFYLNASAPNNANLNSVAINDDIWHHIACVRQDDDIYIFVDGINTFSSPGGYSGDVIDNLTGDLAVVGYDVSNNYLTGYLSELRISKGIARWTSNFIPPTSKYVNPDLNTILMLTADGDQSGTDKVLTFVDDPAIHSGVNTPTGHAYYFANAVDDSITIPDSDDWDFTTGDCTIEFWTKINTWHSYASGFIGQCNETQDWQIYVYNTGAVAMSRAGLAETIRSPAGTLELGKWYHIAVTKNSTTTIIWVNGVNVESGVNASNWAASNQLLRIGYHLYGGNHYWLNGWMSDIRVSKGICRYYNTFDPPMEPLEADSYTKLLLGPTGDQSVSAHTLSMSELKSYTSEGKFNGSYYFNGTTDYITVPDSDDWELGQEDFTIDFWAYPETPTESDASILTYRDGSTIGIYIVFRTDTNQWRISVWNGSNQYGTYDGVTVTTYDTWQHIALVRNGPTVTAYLNGTAMANGTASSNIGTNSVNTSTGVLSIGTDSLNLNRTYKGYLSDIRIIKGKALWTADFVAPQSSFNRSWENRNKLLVTTDDRIYDEYDVLKLSCSNDESWSYHDITFVNDPKIQVVGPFIGSNSFSFDGSDDYITIPDNTDWDYGTNNFTIECFVKLNTLSGNDPMQRFISQGTTSGGVFQNLLAFNSTVGLYFGGIITVSEGNATGWAIDTWYHVAVVRNGDDFTLYKDGVVVGTDSTSSAMDSINARLSIGCFYNENGGVLSNEFNGYLSDIRISNVARYTSTFTPPTEPFVADYATKLLLHPKGDESNGNHELTFEGGAKGSSNTGKFNGSYYFDGGNDYITIPDSDDWDFTTEDCTIDFWVYIESWDTVASGLIGQCFSTQDWEVYVYTTGSVGMGRAGVGEIMSATGVITLGQWYHIAVVKSSTTTVYVNGLVVASGSNVYWTASSQLLRIGHHIYGGNNYWLNGYMSNIRITKGIVRWTEPFIPPTSPDEVTVNTLPVEIEHWDYDSKEATLWVKVPFISSIADTSINLHFDNTESNKNNMSIEETSDDYSGPDGSTPNSYLWNTYSTPLQNLSIQNNKLRSFINSSYTSVGYDSNFSIIGDFDIQVDYELETYPSTNCWRMAFLMGRISRTHWFYLERTYQNTQRYQVLSLAGPSNVEATSNTSDVTGKLRYARSGDTTTMYYWNGSSWVSLYSDSTILGTEEVIVSFHNSVWNSYPTAAGSFYNFKVNKADTIIGGYIGETGSIISKKVWENYNGVWHLSQDPSGGTILNSTKNTNHGTPNGSMTSDDLVDGYISKAIDFDGSNDYINFGDESAWDFGSDNFIIDFFMYASTDSDERDGLFVINNGATNIEIHIGVGTTNWSLPGNNIALSLNYAPVSWAVDVVGSTNVCDSRWHNITLIKISNSWKLYIDNVLELDETYSFSPTSGTLLLGSHITTDRWFKGKIDELKILKGSYVSEAVREATYYSNRDELLRMGPGWKHFMNDENIIIRRVNKINNIPLRNINRFINRSR